MEEDKQKNRITDYLISRGFSKNRDGSWCKYFLGAGFCVSIGALVKMPWPEIKKRIGGEIEKRGGHY